jgi:hypothetical protein
MMIEGDFVPRALNNSIAHHKIQILSTRVISVIDSRATDIGGTG